MEIKNGLLDCCNDYIFDPLHAFIGFQIKIYPVNNSNQSKLGEGKQGNVQKINPFLWFDNQAEEAVKLYVSVFKKSKIGAVTRYGK